MNSIYNPPMGCNVCGAPLSELQDFRAYKHSKCTRCNSGLRHRMFVTIYEQYLKWEFPLQDKKILYVAPSPIEDRIFQNYDIHNLVRTDARQLNNIDIRLDICNMPEVEDDSFDAVYACSVLRYVHDDEAAFSEIYRILRNGGRFLFHVASRPGWKTIEDPETTEEYGTDSFEKFKVGSFRRRYGDNELFSKLQKYFIIKTFYTVDPPTGVEDKWFCAIKTDLWKPFQ